MRLTTFVKVGLLATTVFLAACSSSDDIYVAPISDFDEQFEPEVVWDASAGDGVGEFFSRLHPAINYDKVFVASRDGDVYAYEQDSGDEVWHTNVGPLDPDSWFSAHLPAKVSGGLTAGYKKVFVGTEDGQVIALDAETGETLWNKEVPGEVLSAVSLTDSLVIVNTGSGNVLALNSENGDERWNFQYTVPPLSLRGTSSVTAGQGAVFLGTPTGSATAILSSRGYQLWEHQVANAEGKNELERLIDIDADPVLYGDSLYFAAYQGNIVRLNMRDGSEVWSHEFSSYRGMVIDGDSIFITDDKGYVHSLNVTTGEENWQQTAFENRHVTRPAVVGNYVVVGDFEGYLHWLDRSTGKLVARIDLGGDGIYCDPQVAGDTVYVQTREGDIYAVKAPDDE